MKFCYKKFSHEGEKMLAISDVSVLGKTFEEGELQLTVDESFYRGSECGEKEAIDMVKGSTIVNAVGKDIIALLLKEQLIDKSSVLKIKGVPHAQIVELK